MLNFKRFFRSVKTKVTAEITSEAFSPANPDDKTSGDTYFADRAAY